MLVAVSDSHRQTDHGLSGRTLDAVRGADVVVHAGDFYRTAVYEAFEREAEQLFGVTGNNDDETLRDRLPSSRVVGYEGRTFAVRHRHPSGDTGLAMFGRDRDADCVIFGHSHRPTVKTAADLLLVNPGSHAQPRGNRAAHAEFRPTDDGLAGQLVTTDGTVFEQFTV